jgi:superfamily II DNA or RNA helicase
MTQIIVDYLDEVYIKVRSERHVEQELSELFSFEIAASKYMARKNPRFKNWDGKIYLYSLKQEKVYYGLLDKIEAYAKDNNYEFINNIPNDKNIYDDYYVNEYVNSLKLPFEPRDYQVSGFKDCINSNRRLIVSPTGSGKSLSIYMLSKFYMDENKILIIVPTTNLVEQLEGDFRDYGYTGDMQKIYSGKTKDITTNIVVSTWQSLLNMPKEWFEQFGAVIFDEAHTCKSKSLTSILCAMDRCKYRFGFTGTLQSDEVNILILEGLFNTYNKVISASELMDREELAKLDISIVVLGYDKDTCKQCVEYDYPQEIDFLISNPKRNRFIYNLTRSLEGNTLILFQRVEGHGRILYDMMKDKFENVIFLHGKISGEERQKIIKKIDTMENSVIIASYGVLKLGVNIPNLNNAIFASPYKSNITVLQSIGRILRISSKKKKAKLYDIADDLSYKKRQKFTFQHLIERIKIYNDESYKYQIHEYPIK